MKTMPSAPCVPGSHWCKLVIAVAQRPRARRWPLRVGIATGAVVVGDLVDEGPAQEQSAVGLAPT